MRDIQAELEQWDYDAPTKWEPAEGNILVGRVIECSSDIRGQDDDVLIIQEEDTQLQVAVALDAPQLAKLVKLQRPHPGERVGIKRLSSSNTNEKQYILMVDRSAVNPTRKDKPTEDDAYNLADNSTGATAEERSFIEQALMDSGFTVDTQTPISMDSENTLREIIKRQDEHIARQMESVRELAHTLASTIPQIRPTAETETPRITSEIEPQTKGKIDKLALAMTFASSFLLVLTAFLFYILFIATLK